MNNKNQHIPAGYKSSPLGIIPENWEVKRLGEIGTFKNGLNFTINEEGFSYYFLGVGDFQEKTDIHTKELGQIRLAKELDKEYHLKDDDLVFVRSNGSKSLVGRCVIIHTDHVKATYSGFCIRFRPTSEGTSAQYIKQIIDAGYLRRFLQHEGRGTNITNLNQEILGRLSFPFPDYREQQDILKILQLWDTAISKQTQLVEKLTLRKRGLMQQLLTGEKRLKGFEGEWKEVKLGEVCAFLSNNTLSREQLNNDNGEVQNIHYGDVLIKYPSVLDCNKIVLPFLNEGTYKESMNDFIYDGDLIISDTAEDETVGKACEVQNVGNRKILAGLHTMLLRPNAGIFAPYFLGYYINSKAYHGKLLPLIQGIKVCSIGKLSIQNTSIAVPSIDEQNAIASILIQADKEIELANKKLTRLQEQKKGLMQVLLTGKKRIII